MVPLSQYGGSGQRTLRVSYKATILTVMWCKGIHRRCTTDSVTGFNHISEYDPLHTVYYKT